jgi:hypothetical protein
MLEHPSYRHCRHQEYNGPVDGSALSQMIQNAANNDKEQYKVSTATTINNPMQTEITREIDREKEKLQLHSQIAYSRKIYQILSGRPLLMILLGCNFSN